MAALNNHCEWHFIKLDATYTLIIPLSVSFFYPNNLAPPNVRRKIHSTNFWRWRITFRQTAVASRHYD